VLLVLSAFDGAGLLCRTAFAQQTNDQNSQSGQSWGGSITSGVKSGFSKIGHALNPAPPSKAPAPEDDAVSLKSKSKPGPELYVAIARLYEESGKPADAEQEYQLALADKDKPDYLPALLGYARLKEQLGHAEDAISLYQRAVKVYPKQAAVHNNLGLCYAREGRLDDAAAAMTRAVQLDPKNARYRNNIATVLVDQGKLREAFGHLQQVHGEAAAYYNMGYLLNKKGQTQAAIQHFSLALRADPSMAPAQRWIDYLQKTTQARLPQHPMAAGLRIASEKREPEALRPPDFPDSRQGGAQRTPTFLAPRPERDSASMPRRLPPCPSGEPESDGPTLPGISYDRGEGPTMPSAPLPPPSTNSAVRHLPQVN
jgi:tetratricopeptide (TPR) repeat protein